MTFTVLGSSGFIGSHLVSYLRAKGYEVRTPPRDVQNLAGIDLGHVIYAIGMTGNYRTQPVQTIDAHVNVLQRLMNGARFQSWLYLSSTRVYNGLAPDISVNEETRLSCLPCLDSIYDLSKLLGESLCLAQENPAIRVVRLSNVYGKGMSPHLFIGAALSEIIAENKLLIRESPESSKDYISIDDVVRMIHDVAVSGCHRLYNIASGQATTHADLAGCMRGLGLRVDFQSAAPIRTFPHIDTSRMQSEFGSVQSSILKDFSDLLLAERKRRAS